MRRSPLPRRLAAGLTLSTAVAALALPTPALAQTGPNACTAPVPSSTQEGYVVADPDCDYRADGQPGEPFVALPGAATWAGIADGQAWRIEVPDDWNGDLVLYAHGYRGTGSTVYVANPALRAHFLARGYAWAASSYQTNFYDVEQGVQDTHAMLARFVAVTGETPEDVIIHGDSMGGHVTAVLAERHPEAYAAAYPICGVLGGTELFDYFVDASAVAAALTGTEIGYAEYAADPSAYQDVVEAEILPELFTTRPQLTETGATWAAALEQRSGGERPGFESALAFWNSFGYDPLPELPFVLSVYPGTSAGTLGVASGNVAGNAQTVYQLDGDPAISAAEEQLNETVLRISEDPSATGIPDPQGTAEMPVLSLHTLGDLFVPFSMEQSYARTMAENGNPFVSRAIRATGHCDFAPAELTKGFDDLVLWQQTGHQPAGDAVLDPAAVAAPTFGCRFSAGTRQNFVAAACPTLPDITYSAHRQAIESLLAAGIVQGFEWGAFQPDMTISRAQLASILAKAGGYTPSESAPTFPDVEGSVHEDNVRALAEAGIVRGFDDGRFYPTLQATRGQVASVLARVLEVSSEETGCFPDLGDTVHAGDVCALAALGVIGGKSDGRFHPGDGVTRGQASSLVSRTFG